MAGWTLGEKQRRFTKCIGMLIGYAYANGYELTFGDAYRDPRLHGGWAVLVWLVPYNHMFWVKVHPKL